MVQCLSASTHFSLIVAEKKSEDIKVTALIFSIQREPQDDKQVRVFYTHSCAVTL